MVGIPRKKSMNVAKYTGEKKDRNLEIKRHFTYPNLSPYDEDLGISSRVSKNIRHKIKSISDKGIELGYFEELEACYFEDELAYLILRKFIDIDISKLNLNLFKFKKQFNIDSYKQAANIIAIALSITNDAISR